MKKIKKILSITLAMILIFTATACSSKTEPAASADGKETQQEQPAGSETAQPAAPSGKTVALIMGKRLFRRNLFCPGRCYGQRDEQETGGAVPGFPGQRRFGGKY